jgi:hypothetical protein
LERTGSQHMGCELPIHKGRGVLWAYLVTERSCRRGAILRRNLGGSMPVVSMWMQRIVISLTTCVDRGRASGARKPPKAYREQQHHSSSRRVSPDDVHHGVLAQPDVTPNQAVAEPFLVELENLLGLPVAGSLPNLAAQGDASGFGGR